MIRNTHGSFTAHGVFLSSSSVSGSVCSLFILDNRKNKARISSMTWEKWFSLKKIWASGYFFSLIWPKSFTFRLLWGSTLTWRNKESLSPLRVSDYFRSRCVIGHPPHILFVNNSSTLMWKLKKWFGVGWKQNTQHFKGKWQCRY